MAYKDIILQLTMLLRKKMSFLSGMWIMPLWNPLTRLTRQMIDIGP